MPSIVIFLKDANFGKFLDFPSEFIRVWLF